MLVFNLAEDGKSSLWPLGLLMLASFKERVLQYLLFGTETHFSMSYSNINMY